MPIKEKEVSKNQYDEDLEGFQVSVAYECAQSVDEVKVWVTRCGMSILISRMTDSHIANTIKFLESNNADKIEVESSNGNIETIYNQKYLDLCEELDRRG